MIRRIARLAVENSVAANLAMGAVIVLGLLAWRSMPREVFPDFSLDALEVFTVYPGASPLEVERLVTEPVEGRTMTQGDRAAMQVDLANIRAKFFKNGQALCGEGLIKLDNINVI